MQTMKCACALLITLTVIPCVAAGQSWDGTWKLNLDRSHITGETYVVEDKGNGMMRQDDGNLAYEFACDGKPYKIVADHTDTCTGSPEAGYDDVIKAGDKVIMRQHTTFSPDGKTMTVNETGIREDGTTTTATVMMHRLSGTRGLVGKWQSTKAELPSDISFVIETKGDWIKFSNAKEKSATEGRMDGSPMTETGPNLTPGVAHAVKRDGPNKLHETIQRDGKVITESNLTLSAEGKTITEETWTPGKENEKLTWVWERQ